MYNPEEMQMCLDRAREDAEQFASMNAGDLKVVRGMLQDIHNRNEAYKAVGMTVKPYLGAYEEHLRAEYQKLINRSQKRT